MSKMWKSERNFSSVAVSINVKFMLLYDVNLMIDLM